MNILILQGPNLNLLGLKSAPTGDRLTLDKLNKALRIKEIKRSKHLFPIKDSTFRNKDLMEGIKVILSENVTMSKITEKFEKTFSKKLRKLNKN